MLNHPTVFPLSYAIPDECIVAAPPVKTQVWADILPGAYGCGYNYGPTQEAEYDAAYGCARFAITGPKSGWDCLRHYEILAAGTIPVFANNSLERCPHSTMTTYPKDLVRAATRELLPWSDTTEHRAAYDRYIKALLEHTRTHCSTSSLARQFLGHFPELSDKSHPPHILLLHTGATVNYSREFLWIGLHRVVQAAGGTARLHPGTACEFLWSDFPSERCGTIHGSGYKYARRLPAAERPPPWSDDDVRRSIATRHWDIIVYAPVGPDEGPHGSVPELPFWSEVRAAQYPPERIAFIYGGDGYGQQDMHSVNRYSAHIWHHAQIGLCFVRELNL